MRAAIRIITALAVLAACVALGVACSKHEAAPTGLRNFLVKASPYPPANSAAGALRLLQYCWRNRDASLYETVLSGDFCFKCSVRDSAGSGSAGGCDFGRDDELQVARHLFETGTATDSQATGIMFDFTSDLVAVPDARPGKDPGWHMQIRAQAWMRIYTSEGITEISGLSLFYLVRGDSVSIPPDLADRGFKPDPNRWYVERWEDETTSESGRATAAAPTHPLPMRHITLCEIKERYR